MRDDIMINKSETIQRCIKRINDEYQDTSANLENYTKQDSIILNIQRLCEACIDMATHVIRVKKLGVPQKSRDVFVLLEEAGIITAHLSQSLQNMVGFRNIAVHDYKKLNIAIVEAIIQKEMYDSVKFVKCLLAL